jgi:DNA/RNA-binding domain of Phe-tRNA-synthetase-like protein
MTAGWRGDLSAASIDPAVFVLRPDYVAVLIVATGLTPGPTTPASEALLRKAEAQALIRLDGHDPHDLPEIQEWRTAYTAFGVKPREGRSSVEALLRRIEAGLPRIDRLTDTYNAVSVMHLIPVGGEDLLGYAGAPRLTVANGDESFDTVANGEPFLDSAAPGEVVWRDDIGVTCRRWNWRQGVRTRLTTSTTSALFILDGLGLKARDQAEGAAKALTELLTADSPAATFTTRTISTL